MNAFFLDNHLSGSFRVQVQGWGVAHIFYCVTCQTLILRALRQACLSPSAGLILNVCLVKPRQRTSVLFVISHSYVSCVFAVCLSALFTRSGNCSSYHLPDFVQLSFDTILESLSIIKSFCSQLLCMFFFSPFQSIFRALVDIQFS